MQPPFFLKGVHVWYLFVNNACIALAVFKCLSGHFRAETLHCLLRILNSWIHTRLHNFVYFICLLINALNSLCLCKCTDVRSQQLYYNMQIKHLFFNKALPIHHCLNWKYNITVFANFKYSLLHIPPPIPRFAYTLELEYIWRHNHESSICIWLFNRDPWWTDLSNKDFDTEIQFKVVNRNNKQKNTEFKFCSIFMH